jgi:hypothetical protein
MKPKTVILLAIVGSLLLFVGAFAIFFASGGQVLLMRPYSSARAGNLEITAQDEEVIDAMVGLDFTFEPTPGLVAWFQGKRKGKFLDRTWYGVDYYLVGEIELKGKVLQAIPSSNFYSDLTKEDFYNQLRREIHTRIAIPDAEFKVCYPEHDFWGSKPTQLKKRPNGKRAF